MLRGDQMENGRILIVYDNRTTSDDLTPGWGFSALIELRERRILFDTGADGQTLMANMGRLKAVPSMIDTVFLSHSHGDHTGGIEEVLAAGGQLEVYLGHSFSDRLKTAVRGAGAKLHEVTRANHLFGTVYTTGELGLGLKEQSLIIDTEKGLVVITGCAHPGIVTIAKAATEQLSRPIDLLFGGFHLGGISRGKVRSIITSLQELGVSRAGPCHCTGGSAIALFEEVYKESFVSVGVGTTIKF